VQVEALRQPLEEVRCLACRVVYELPADAGGVDVPGCPNCGAVVWLAATIRPAESEFFEEA
jgi:NAD-dependent SIR2 family protein deacetylase